MCSFSLLKKAHVAETFNLLESTCYDEANKHAILLMLSEEIEVL